MGDLENRVWQRVLGQPQQPETDDWKLLILYAQELAAVYGRLMKETSGRNREILRKLYEGEQANIACLKGLSALQGNPVKLRPLQNPKEPAGKALEKCYHRTRRAMTEYMGRSASAEFGEVFRTLANREADHCALLAEVLGNLK